MKISEIRAMDMPALRAELSTLLKALFSLRMQLSTQRISDTSVLKKTRRLVARVRTIMTEKRILEAEK